MSFSFLKSKFRWGGIAKFKGETGERTGNMTIFGGFSGEIFQVVPTTYY